MEIDLEDAMMKLYPIIEKLVNKYVSGSSTSVSEDTLKQLTEAVIYTIKENISDNAIMQNTYNGKEDVELMYDRGKLIIMRKLEEIKQNYEIFSSNYDDYGVRNYRDTVINGISGFLKVYDPLYKPHKTVLTIDYQTMINSGNAVPGYMGVDLINWYMSHIIMEKMFLDCFQHEYICAALGRIISGYKNLFYDNICAEILFLSVGCVLSGEAVSELYVSEDDCEKIKQKAMTGDINELVMDAVSHLVDAFLENVHNEIFSKDDIKSYFIAAVPDMVSRIKLGVEYDSLENVFSVC